MPALFTRMSSEPSSFWVALTMAAICSPLLMSAPLYDAFTPNRCSSETRSVSIAAASPKPFSMIEAPSAASASAMPWPMPLVDPVTRATFPLRLMSLSFITLYVAPRYEPSGEPGSRTRA